MTQRLIRLGNSHATSNDFVNAIYETGNREEAERTSYLLEGESSMTLREKQVPTKQADHDRESIQQKTVELESELQEILSILEDKDAELQENIQRTQELERLLEEREQTTQIQREQEMVPILPQQHQMGSLEMDRITPEFQRAWQLEKMRYGLD